MKDNSFEFNFEYNTSGDDQVILETTYQYAKDKMDQIRITNKEICVTGFRSSRNSILIFSTSTRNILYKEMIRSLLFAYFTTGNKFNYGNMSCRYNNAELDLSDIVLQNFTNKDLEEDFRLTKNICEKLFVSGEMNNKFIVTLTEFLIGYNTENYTLENFWKSYNALYAVFAPGIRSEREQLDSISTLINGNDFPANSKSLQKVQEFNYLNHVLYKRIMSKFKYGKKADRHRKFLKKIRKYADHQILETMKSIIVEEHSKSKNKKSNTDRYEMTDQEVQEYVNFVATNTARNYRMVLDFVINQHVYQLRCMYFHGEKATPIFLSKNNNDVTSIMEATDLLKVLIIDLIRTQKYLNSLN